ncbi:MAG: primosomal protein N' [Candidatus Yanofskybacteria bacterium RIFCSPLOWO2_01_FULL_49_17]|uniref:Primosomal protein N n=1 Tax=Candidatus Yanofskybacteria bacterium RIFCSPLOWO2_01_FULL_49_17 TaxID=1802700 RepID=A0A1F8GQN4_9BACT|nr:MAG: primosomal protein N' [Candidatus Yanofskybacteria bacterium RIFCSPLOWO2_01_FULL_49_17]
MYILEVIPLSVLPPQVPQILSYYGDLELPKGAVVQVPLHNRKVSAVVINSSAIDKRRILVKKSAFQLNKITSILSAESQVGEYQFKLALWLANEYLSPLGLALKATLPPFFGKKKYAIKIQSPNFKFSNTAGKPDIIICRSKDGLKHLPKSIGQMLILVPETSYIPHFKKANPEASIIHSGIKNEEYHALWKQVQGGEMQMIIGTRQALFLPFNNLKNIIIIDPLHEFYKSDYSPKYKAPALAEYAARLYGAKLTVISDFLGVESYIRVKKGELVVSDYQARPVQVLPVEVIDLIAELKQGYVGALSVPLKRRLAEAVKAGKKILIFAARRGYAGIVVCKRCGFTSNCPRCNIPMRVHMAMDKILVCHHCSINQPYPQFCANCHSSEIKPTGPAGSQKIYEELQKMIEFGQLTKTPIVILDADVTQNQTEEDEIMETVRNPLAGGQSVILIATTKVFSYIFDDSFDLVAIPQFDALSVSPDYQTDERLWYQLEKLADFQPEKIITQSYDTARVPHEVFAHDYEKLYTAEAEARQALAYPPFSKIIRLTYTHRKAQVAVNAGRQLIEKLKMAAAHLRIQQSVQISDSSPMFLSKEKDFYTFSVIIKFLNSDSKLVRELVRYAPSNWLIDVDPRQMI